MILPMSTEATQNLKLPPTSKSISITSNKTVSLLDVYVGVKYVASVVTPCKDLVLYPFCPLFVVLRFYYAIQFLFENVKGPEVEMNDSSDFYDVRGSGWQCGWGINNYCVCIVYVISTED